MSQEREVVKVKGLTVKPVGGNSEEEVKAQFTDLTRSERKARLAQVMERGVVSDRLHVELPPELYGEWVRNDSIEVNRLQTLGFWIDTEYAPKRALHGDGTNAGIIGDVIFMVCERETHEIIEEIRHEQHVRNHNPKKQKEEEEFDTSVKASTGGIIPTIVESQTHEARKDEISAALKAANAEK